MLKVNLEFSKLKDYEIYSRDYQKKINEIHDFLHSGDHTPGTTWIDWPLCYDKKEFSKILKLSKEIKENSDALLVVGIGGSYLGARSGLELLSKKSKVEVVFVGMNMDYFDLNEKLELLKDKDVTVNVISKSGTTVEILSTLNIIERFMKNKYKSEYKKRMIFTTDKQKGYLRERANLEGFETLCVPDNMGGRYSVLSAVGLLPFAVADVNIKKIMEGASFAYSDLFTNNIENNPAYQYAIYRHLLNKKLGKKVEVFTSFTKRFGSFGDWLQQLFDESEGKDKKGLFVTSLTYSTDLHSVGQFVQDGSPILAETFIDVKNVQKDNEILNVPLGSPIKFLDGKKFSELSRAGFDGTIKAHSEAGVPIAIIEIDDIDEVYYGYLVYFFELTCAVSGYLLGVNPFNQPGVEQYKAYMKEFLKK
ncbi:MAG: glucose-6-phosphate isomerase [Clostridia bacterium]|nr:glucose-6-phosphate isomerase [Clostridia bacterium]